MQYCILNLKQNILLGQPENSKETFRFFYKVLPSEIDTASCRILFTCDNGYLNYCVYDTKKEVLILFKQLIISSTVSDLLKGEEFLQKPFLSSHLCVHADEMEFIPSDFSQTASQNYKFQNNFKELTLLFDSADSSIPALQSFFPNLQLNEYHYFMMKLADCKPEFLKEKSTLFLSIRANHLHIMMYEKEALVLANSFIFDNHEELLFFVLKSISEGNGTPEETAVYIHFSETETSKEEKIFAMLSKYILQMSILEPQYSHTTGFFHNKEDLSDFFPLVNLSVCV
ncbi:MAG: DUF3822 family protein [Bacteroidia bacterium]|nr:DUF3822 family protein [Bacteroidia bacterium]